MSITPTLSFYVRDPVELQIPGKRITSVYHTSANIYPFIFLLTDGCDYGSVATDTRVSPVTCPNSRLYGAGSDSMYQLGIGTNTASKYSFTAGDTTDVLANDAIIGLSLGNQFGVIQKSTGVLYSWGVNNLGQLGGMSL
jgi:alpha-tubulin suppressor-like RCC1 family protein